MKNLLLVQGQDLVEDFPAFADNQAKIPLDGSAATAYIATDLSSQVRYPVQVQFDLAKQEIKCLMQEVQTTAVPKKDEMFLYVRIVDSDDNAYLLSRSVTVIANAAISAIQTPAPLVADPDATAGGSGEGNGAGVDFDGDGGEY